MSAQAAYDRDRLAALLKTLEPGTYVFWGVQYEGRRGTHVTIAWDPHAKESTRELAERDAAELLEGRRVDGRVVSRVVQVGGWAATDTAVPDPVGGPAAAV